MLGLVPSTVDAEKYVFWRETKIFMYPKLCKKAYMCLHCFLGLRDKTSSAAFVLHL